jgi:nucleotide-binding universal stress UspA family protein
MSDSLEVEVGITMAKYRVMVGVDGSSGSLLALEWAVREARLHDAVLEIIHVDEFRRDVLETYAPQFLKESVDLLESAIAIARQSAPTLEIVGRILEPPAGERIVEESRVADLLVVGSRGLSGLRQLALGSISDYCAHHAQCPVVIVRQNFPQVD